MNAKPPLLQAFRQPWVLLSILILLLNDHILKNSVLSWLANRGQVRQSKSSAAATTPGRLAYGVLALGALASLAFLVTEYPTISSVQHLIVDKTTLYAFDYSSATESVYSSRDRGKTWTLEDNPSAEIVQALKTPLALPKTMCDPANPQTCYHITVQQQVEESQDGGQTWKNAGQNLPERKSYMTRLEAMKLSSWINLRFETPDYSPHAFDMVFLPGKGSSTLMVAMGKDGFLLHAPGKTWQYNPMRIDNPDGSVFYFPNSYPFQAASLSDAMSATLWEWLWAWGVGVLVYQGFSLLAAFYAVRQSPPSNGRGWKWVFAPLLWPCSWLVLLGFTLFCNNFPYNWYIFPWLYVLPGVSLFLVWYSAPLIGVFMLVVPDIIWQRAGKRPPHFYSRVIDVGLASLVALSIGLSFVAWAFGWIVSYESALAIAAALGLISLVAGVIIHRLLRELTA